MQSGAVVLETSLLAVFVAGLLGGVHCAGMCGGIVSALALTAPNRTLKGIQVVGVNADGSARAAPSLLELSPLLQNGLYNAGRLLTYITLGFFAGSVGSVSTWFVSVYPLQQIGLASSSGVLVFIGCYVMGLSWPVRAIERLGVPIWQRVRPLAVQQLARSGVVNRMLTGALWGLVPCGMVYAVLVAAIASGDALRGALLMLAFGLGTLPNLLLLGLSASWLQRARRNPRVRLALGVLICSFGLMGLLRLDAAQRVPLIRALCTGFSL